MKKIILFVCAAAGIFEETSLAQEYPQIRDAKVNVLLQHKPQDSTYFFYNYSVTNGSSSSGSIIEFQIDISRAPNSTSFDTVGLRFDKAFAEGDFRRHFPLLADNIVPVGFTSTPGIWTGMLINDLTASFGGDSRLLIRPRETLSGFALMSKGIPAIRRYLLRPRFDYDLFPDIEDTTSTLTFAQRDSILEAVNFRGVTIGPTAPPANFVASRWLDTLASYKHQALALGWIVNQGILTSLDQKLENAKQQLQRGNASAAKNILQAFVNEVEALNNQGNQVTSEAYALLKFNAEYLISKL